MTIDDIAKMKREGLDVNEVLKGIELDENELDFVAGHGFRDDDALQELLEALDVYEVIEGEDENYRYVMADSGDQLYKIEVSLMTDEEDYTDLFFDFSTIEEADQNEFLDDDAINDFFDSANFLVAPGSELDGEPSKYLWEDFKAVGEAIERSKESGDKIHMYTLIEAEGAGYITPGCSIVNRIGYFLADELIPMSEDIRYW